MQQIATIDREACPKMAPLFIGNYGNNAGNRQALPIIKIAKPDVLNAGQDSIANELIHYPEQLSFTPGNRNESAWDAVAFFRQDHTLPIFTKDRTGENTAHYTLPDTAGNDAAQRIRLITAVSRKIAMLYCWLTPTLPGSCLTIRRAFF